MTHLPYLFASYGLTLCAIVYLSLQAYFRIRKDKRQLEKLKNLPHTDRHPS
ncbi:hypothetical protein JGUZn3_18660 [Entomobacter blattae]|uniref:Heme exporter protein D n=1 Tax=Entomobacter blattae TaxID=2762277 RepID=A0A7H1NTH0_9PROT|nr:hypothetical protein JGUZn3_18660 [Entomobacter blattae]